MYLIITLACATYSGSVWVCWLSDYMYVRLPHSTIPALDYEMYHCSIFTKLQKSIYFIDYMQNVQACRMFQNYNFFSWELHLHMCLRDR